MQAGRWLADLVRDSSRVAEIDSTQQQHVDTPERGGRASLKGELPFLDGWSQIEQAPQDLLRLDPGERGARAEVRAVAEREVNPGLPAQVQAVWVGERGRVAVGRREAPEHLLAARDDRFTEGRVVSGHAGGQLHGLS